MVVNGLTQVEKLNKKLLKGRVFFCGNFTNTPATIQQVVKMSACMH